MLEILVWAALVIFFIFAFVVFFGAPYLRTLTPQMEAALDLIDLKPGQTLVELGSGDGKVMVAAAKRGLNVIGYEINPILALFTWLRTRKYGRQVRVVWGNFWLKKMPPTDGIFIFLLPKYMQKLDNKITQEYSKPVKLVSFAFKVPGKKTAKEIEGIYLYNYK